MKTKLKVGDKIRIKSREWYDENKDYKGHVELKGETFIYPMAEFCGKEAVIINVDSNGEYRIDIDNLDWIWTDEMFEDAIISEHSIKSNVFWYAVDDDGCGTLFKDKPLKSEGVWDGNTACYFDRLETVQLFHTLTYDDEPIQIEIRKV